MGPSAEGSGSHIAVLVLAAGKGTRMKSRRSKVLHEMCGRSMLGHVIAAVEGARPDRLLVVVGRDADEVRVAFEGRAEFVLQAEQNGTGHAVLEARPALEGFTGEILILYGDGALLRSETIDRMRRLKAETGAPLVVLTTPVPMPGLIVRGPDGRVERVVETTDATPEEMQIREGNSGVYLVDADLLWDALSKADTDNAQGEIYLTDIVRYAVEQRGGVEALQLDDPEEGLGINTRAELALAAGILRRRKLESLMASGVTIVDPAHTYVDVDVEVGRDSVIEPGCVIQGDSVLGEGVHVRPHCVIESSRLDDGVVIGPSAHLRPGTHLGRGVRIGNFVEVKNSTLGAGVKADHLSYIGDADVGEGAAFGCGAITVNYDWDAKHRTEVGPGANIGCNANLIAPVRVEKDAAVAAGSTITQPVPEGALGVARAKQRNVEGWRDRRPTGKSGKTGKTGAAGKTGKKG